MTYATSDGTATAGADFLVENATTVKGSASGSSPILDGPTQVSAAGPISGTLHVIFQDGSSDDYPITGSFAATGTK